MKKLSLLLPVLALWLWWTAAPVVVLTSTIGCSTTNTNSSSVAYNSLASVGMTTDAAMKSYMDGVVRGSVPTNNVPAVAKVYDQFQIPFRLAVAAAQGSTNTTLASPELMSLSSKTLAAIAAAKGGK